MFSCKSGLKGFAIIKFPEIRAAGLEGSPLLKTLLGISSLDTTLKKNLLIPNLSKRTFSITGLAHLCPWVCVSWASRCYPDMLLFLQPVQAATWASSGACRRRKLLFAAVWGCAAPGREKNLSHSSLPQGTWAEQISFPGASSVIPLANGHSSLCWLL